ncbi:phosphate ABC transporter substrate-binding protein PstS family protein [Pseudomonas oryzihabitans]|uniref:PstS family phosphate ABC transporter substrate-binding protein n=1 Tax=Pseudomonas oryzihabitans TaxID=47885 RepID=UPI00289397E5|nr:phosphate ABC transporter substrate-binding protein PstS family protein [Pseudomonas oryzihabitans]MDT3722489.1 phosphate ABC transporter substrate-binding protein PstS family protein [Pseudomonas oryzihabitans]
MHLRGPLTTLALVLALGGPTVARATDVDPALPEYQKVSGVSGNLSSVGSDTLANLVTLWAESYKREYPNLNIQIQAAGSSTAPPALTEGTASIGPMSRKMKDAELQAFEQRFGYRPTAVPVAIDALAIFVHKDNPLRQLTLEQVDAIFSSTRLCGGPRELRTWGDLGLTGDWARRPIQLFGRNSVSGTYGYFKEAALCRGDFRANVNEQPGSASVVQAISQSLGGIGYSGIGYQTASVHTVALAKQGTTDYVEDNQENTLSGRYPLARFLYVYVNKTPNRPLNPLEGEFLRLILSRTGQEAVVKDGYIPLPAPVVQQALKSLGY